MTPGDCAIFQDHWCQQLGNGWRRDGSQLNPFFLPALGVDWRRPPSLWGWSGSSSSVTISVLGGLPLWGDGITGCL